MIWTNQSEFQRLFGFRLLQEMEDEYNRALLSQIYSELGKEIERQKKPETTANQLAKKLNEGGE